MLMIIIILIMAFSAISLAMSWFLSRSEASRRKAALIRRMGSISMQDQSDKGLNAMLQKLPIIAKLETQRKLEFAQKSYAAELPRMLEIIALGVRSGLGFDQAFALYARRFQTPLSALCLKHLEVWERGLISREQGLTELAEAVNLPVFSRFVSTTLRALNYGAALNALLLDLAEQTRKTYRSEQQETVAKAPVKMLLPTGALILPAMLLLVIGPILLQLTERMI